MSLLIRCQYHHHHHYNHFEVFYNLGSTMIFFNVLDLFIFLSFSRSFYFPFPTWLFWRSNLGNRYSFIQAYSKNVADRNTIFLNFCIFNQIRLLELLRQSSILRSKADLKSVIGMASISWETNVYGPELTVQNKGALHVMLCRIL